MGLERRHAALTTRAAESHFRGYVMRSRVPSFTARHALLVAGLVAASAIAACSDSSAPAPSVTGQQQRTTSPPLTGDAVLRGQVLGVDSANGGPWHTTPI